MPRVRWIFAGTSAFSVWALISSPPRASFSPRDCELGERIYFLRIHSCVDSFLERVPFSRGFGHIGSRKARAPAVSQGAKTWALRGRSQSGSGPKSRGTPRPYFFPDAKHLYSRSGYILQHSGISFRSTHSQRALELRRRNASSGHGNASSYVTPGVYQVTLYVWDQNGN